ncbi:T-complex protein 1 subunit theta [Nosema granulosis]|uniref:T-complex protein 1 subunit theta n=1 Tax=Nosema granulosis TaxID=83296 RepID=A0A9P6GWZ6_9MICR|nr:T-complex protein 1 subunit theta [Nosema granulosis]
MEIPNAQHPGLISKSQTEEKARFTTAISKITPVVNLIKKMYGSSRLTKLIRTDYNTYKLTQTPAVILDNIKINHPLVKLLGDYVKKLESMGDSSKFFMILVGFLIEETIKILDKGVKATVLSNLIREVSEEIDSLDLSRDTGDIAGVLDSLIKEPVGRKLVLESILEVQSFSTEKIRICKIASGSLEESYVVRGMVFEREPEGLVKEKEDCSTSIFNTSIDIPRGELKSTIQMESADQLSSFSAEEVLRMKKKVEEISSEVIIFSGRINDIYLDLLDKANKLVFKVLSKHDLRRLRELLGGSISQEFTSTTTGRASRISVVSEGNKKYTKFISDNNTVCTIVLKHPLEYKLDELERSINKALVALQKNVKNQNEKNIKVCSEDFEKKLCEIFENKAGDCLRMYSEGEGEDSLEKHLVYESIANSFKGFESFKRSPGLEIFSTKSRAICYALEFVGTMYEIEDYLVGIPPKLNIKPQMNQHWDEDH